MNAEMDPNYADAAPSDQSMGEEHGEEQHGETSLIPKSLCPGMAVGDTIELRIVGEQEKDYEVAYEKEPESEQEPKTEKPAPRDAEMASMME